MKRYNDFFENIYSKKSWLLTTNKWYPQHQRTYSKQGSVKVYVLFLSNSKEGWKPIAYDYNKRAIEDLQGFLIYLLRMMAVDLYEIRVQCMKESKFETSWLSAQKNEGDENFKRENEVAGCNRA